MTFSVENNRISVLCRKVENIPIARKVVNRAIRGPVIEENKKGFVITVADGVDPYALAQTLAKRTKVRLEKEKAKK